jgi:hypothetical protein
MTARSKPGRRSSDPAPSAEDHYKREKARRGRDAGRDSELIAAAKREYLALLAQEAVKGKGGRPKKKPAPPSGASPDADTTQDNAADNDEE